MFSRSPRPRFPRRGVTLLEMLVAVALLVLMMSVIVQVFTAATTAVHASRSFQELDTGLRQIDATIRQDLQNVTARLTPPLDPKNNLGYFTYGENSFADSQGEDSDDYLAFTVKAPEGQVFTGRYWPPSVPAPTTPDQLSYQRQSLPITIQSQYAEVIYFLRNGNLYRRVLLVAPDRTLSPFISQFLGAFNGVNSFAGSGWQGTNDVSAHPLETGPIPTLVANTLSDLTNRENRYGSPRFVNDYVTGTGTAFAPDGIPDDVNGDSVPDYWPSLYFNCPLINEPAVANRSNATFQSMAFPWVYPYAYTQPDPSGLSGLGWIHTPDPSLAQTTVALLNKMNHNPLEIGDSLATPALGSAVQTWWGFPTWRETMSGVWRDPFFTPLQATPVAQATGLNPFPANTTVANGNVNLLPPMTAALRTAAQPFTDGYGSTSFWQVASPPAPSVDYLWVRCWEDDLIMTGVRSFDVKAYDNSFAGYVDLGWGDDGRLLKPYVTAAVLGSWTPSLLADNSSAANSLTPSGLPLVVTWPPGGTQTFRLIGDTYAHEGRIPPLVKDYRLDPQMADELSYNLDASAASTANVGDNSLTAVRLRRVWDTWSTDYTNAPSVGVDPATGQPYPNQFSASRRPIYPSYPAPYPMPLRGIQIQIRVTDPRNERLKTLTIRQDFSDKL